MLRASILRRRAPRRLVGAALPAALLMLSVGVAPASGVGVPQTLHVNISVPSVLAATATKLWVANTGTASVLEFNIKTGGEVHNINAHKDQLFGSDAMVVVGTQVWVANSQSDSITVLDATSGDLVRILHGVKLHFAAAPLALAYDAKHVFVLGQGGSAVVELAASSGKLVQVLRGPRFHFLGATALAVSGQGVWVLSSRSRGSLTELNAVTGNVVRIVSSARASLDHPTAMSAVGNVLWISNGAGDHLSAIEASSGRLLAAPRIAHLNGNAVTSILAVGRRLWLASTASPSWVACLGVTRKVLRLFGGRFGYPALFGGGLHVWVVDRTQSRVTELNSSTMTVVRVLVN